MSIKKERKITNSDSRWESAPFHEIIYQRLKEYAPMLDINPERGCIDFISNITEFIGSGAGGGGTPLRFTQLCLPSSILGIVVPSVPTLVVANPILWPGFDGTLDLLTFHALQYDVTIKKGQSICSLFPLPFARSNFVIREINANETRPDRINKEVASMELICGAGRFTTSRQQTIIDTVLAEKKDEAAARLNDLKAEIRLKIKATPMPGSSIPPELIERFVIYIIEKDLFDSKYRMSPSRQSYNHRYEIIQFPTETALEERLWAVKEDTMFIHTIKEKLEWGNLYYVLLIVASARNPWD